MKTSDILHADVLDIVFDERNKMYGAYDLRKNYNKRINMALAGTALFCLLFVVGNIFAHSKKSIAVPTGPDVILAADPEKPREITPPPPPPAPPQPQVAVASFTPPLITPDEQVPPDQVVKDMDDMTNIKIGNVDKEGVPDDAIAPPPEKSGDATAKPKVTEDIDGRFNVIEIPAEFPGGTDAWRKYLERNLNNELPVDNGAPQGKYTVVVSFTVDSKGVISDVRAENDPGYGTKTEAIRVIQKGPNWKPAFQNGHAVIFRHKQSITFTVNEQ